MSCSACKEPDKNAAPSRWPLRLYAAHFNYATALEAAGKPAEAITQYLAALTINTRGREALTALARLKALPTLPAPPCQPTKVAPYAAMPGDFVISE